MVGCLDLPWHIEAETKWQHFWDDTFRCIFVIRMLQFSYSFTEVHSKGPPIDNTPALVQMMAWHRTGNKPLFELMKPIYWRIYVCVTQPQWVKIYAVQIFWEVPVNFQEVQHPVMVWGWWGWDGWGSCSTPEMFTGYIPGFLYMKLWWSHCLQRDYSEAFHQIWILCEKWSMQWVPKLYGYCTGNFNSLIDSWEMYEF